MEKHIQITSVHLLILLVCSLMLMNAQVHAAGYVNLTFVESAVSKGAVCLDGSPPAYSFQKGYGDGADNWVIYMEGGSWCEKESECIDRKLTVVGSSLLKPKNRIFLGAFLDDDQIINPDLYNWNKVSVVYCDGASFMADIQEVDETNVTYYRGARVFDAIMEDLLAKGMKNAKNAILAGGSAGGLATILHCDYFRGLIPNASRVKCISDSGFFIRAKDLPGASVREGRFANVVAQHKLAKLLPASCTSKMDPSLCLFPEYLVGDIKTPLFLLESAFDSYQVRSFGGIEFTDECIVDVRLCTSAEIQAMKGYRSALIETLQNLNKSSSRGMFVHSCQAHGHITENIGWSCSSVVGHNVVQNKTIAAAIGDWYFDRSSFQHIDTNDTPKYCKPEISSTELRRECIRQLS